jgi:hypothetical protein
MTNVPTLYNLFEIFLFPPIISFFMGFMIHYLWFRNIMKGIALGLISVGLYFVVLVLFLPRNTNYAGMISGAFIGFTGTFVSLILSRKKVNIDILQTNKKQLILSMLIVILLISPVAYYHLTKNQLEFSVSDPENDLRYAGYDEIIATDKKGIDIIGMSSRIDGDDVILEMQLADDAQVEGAEYRFFVATQKRYFWSMTLDAKMIEADGMIRQATVPMSMIEDRDVFQVLAVASIYDQTRDLDLVDSCEY